jgi:hypothetical protein
MGRESQAFAVVSSAMLASNDVLDMLRTAPRFEGSCIRSDDRYVHGRFAGAARPGNGNCTQSTQNLIIESITAR